MNGVTRMGKLTFEHNFKSHWGRSGIALITHSEKPKSWPWWRLFSATIVSLGTRENRTIGGKRMWVYTRWGAFYVGVYYPKASTI